MPHRRVTDWDRDCFAPICMPGRHYVYGVVFGMYLFGLGISAVHTMKSRSNQYEGIPNFPDAAESFGQSTGSDSAAEDGIHSRAHGCIRMQQGSVRLVGGRVNGLGPTEAPVAQFDDMPDTDTVSL